MMCTRDPESKCIVIAAEFIHYAFMFPFIFGITYFSFMLVETIEGSKEAITEAVNLVDGCLDLVSNTDTDFNEINFLTEKLMKVRLTTIILLCTYLFQVLSFIAFLLAAKYHSS